MERRTFGAMIPTASPFFGMEGMTAEQIMMEDKVTSITSMAQLLADRLPKEELVGLFIMLDEHSDHDVDMRPIHAAVEGQVRRIAPELFSMEIVEDPSAEEDPIIGEEDALEEALILAGGSALVSEEYHEDGEEDDEQALDEEDEAEREVEEPTETDLGGDSDDPLEDDADIT